jgi:hypothetical protein
VTVGGVRIMDECPTCGYGDLDLSPGVRPFPSLAYFFPVLALIRSSLNALQALAPA